jgi:hypothetical protein
MTELRTATATSGMDVECLLWADSIHGIGSGNYIATFHRSRVLVHSFLISNRKICQLFQLIRSAAKPKASFRLA